MKLITFVESRGLGPHRALGSHRGLGPHRALGSHRGLGPHRALGNSVKMLAMPPGAELGIPLNIIQNVFTNLHYGHDVTGLKMILLQFLIGYYTYSKDRFEDAKEFRNSPYPTYDEKIELYELLLNYESHFALSYDIVITIIVGLLLFDGSGITNLPFLLLLYSCEYYKDLKRIFPLLKPFYVSSMWTLSSVILPCVLYDHDYSILKDVNDYMPCFFTIFALTNIADIADVKIDRQNDIKTIPVTFGTDFTTSVSQVSLFLSSLLFAMNPHYLDRPLVNAGFELQNAALSAYLIYSSFFKDIDDHGNCDGVCDDHQYDETE